MKMEYAFNDDKTAVTLKTPPEVTIDADGLAVLIGALGKLRSHVLPPVPDRLPPLEAKANVIGDADFEVGPGARGVMVAFRHPGFGWIRCLLLREQAQRLIDRLTTVTAIAVDPPRH